MNTHTDSVFTLHTINVIGSVSSGLCCDNNRIAGGVCLKRNIICIMAFLFLFMISGCEKKGEVIEKNNNDTEQEYLTNENMVLEFPKEYKAVDGRVTFDCKVTAPDIGEVKEFTAIKKEIDSEQLYNNIENKIVIDSYEEYESYSGDILRSIDSGDICISLAKDLLFYNNTKYTAGLYGAFKIDELDINSNIDKFLTDKELAFASREEAEKMLYADLDYMGLKNNSLDIHLYVCDMETLENEYSIYEESNELAGGNPEDKKIYEGYYLCARQLLDGVPVFTKIARVMYQDVEANSQIKAFYTGEGLQFLDVNELYDFKETGNVHKLLAFEDIAQSLSEHYNYYITDDNYLVYSAKLYNYVKSDNETYSVTPVWIFKTYVTDVNGMVSQRQFEINAVTGEVFERD